MHENYLNTSAMKVGGASVKDLLLATKAVNAVAIYKRLIKAWAYIKMFTIVLPTRAKDELWAKRSTYQKLSIKLRKRP
tara:strand:- start:158 stop:391 length:234 start_codon:yes stop_codon:yes gene_type:complete